MSRQVCTRSVAFYFGAVQQCTCEAGGRDYEARVLLSHPPGLLGDFSGYSHWLRSLRRCFQ